MESSFEALKIDELFTAAALATRWEMSPGTLSNWRIAGKGPKFIKVGKKIFYRITDVRDWESKNTKQNTVS